MGNGNFIAIHSITLFLIYKCTVFVAILQAKIAALKAMFSNYHDFKLKLLRPTQALTASSRIFKSCTAN